MTKGAHWSRPKTKTYDYNDCYNHGYYKPMVDFLDRRDRGKATAEKPPKAQTFSERIAIEYPLGKPHHLPRGDIPSSAPSESPFDCLRPRRPATDDDLPRKPRKVRFPSLEFPRDFPSGDDLGDFFDDPFPRRKQLMKPNFDKMVKEALDLAGRPDLAPMFAKH